MRITHFANDNALSIGSDGSGPLATTGPLWHTICKYLNKLLCGLWTIDYGIGLHVTDGQGRPAKVYYCEGALRQWVNANPQQVDCEALGIQLDDLCRTALKAVLRSLLEAVEEDVTAGSAVPPAADPPKQEDAVPPVPVDPEVQKAITAANLDYVRYFLNAMSTLRDQGVDTKAFGVAMRTLAQELAAADHDPANGDVAFELQAATQPALNQLAIHGLLDYAVQGHKIHSWKLAEDGAIVVWKNDGRWII